MTDALQPDAPLRALGTEATPIVPDEGRPLTRRELRARERELHALAAGQQPAESEITGQSEVTDFSASPVSAVSAVPPVRMPPLRSHAHPHAQAHVHVAPRRGPALATKAFSLAAMLAVAGIAVATSVPANALMSSADVAAARMVNSTSDSLKPNAQMLKGDSVGPAVVPREAFASVSAAVAYGFSHARHDHVTFTNNPSGTIQWPFPFGVPISDYFGPRIAPTEGASTFHKGIDFDPGNGTPIQSIADGVVREVDPYDNNGLGVHVIVDHLIGGKLVSSVYGHMQVGSIQVTQGQSVKVGDIVGLVGNTGVSTGAHMHFEIHLGGSVPVDPYAWLKANAN